VEQLTIGCPSGLRQRYLKNLSPNELLFAVNCTPASSSGGLYLWRPQVDPSPMRDLLPWYATVLDATPFGDGLFILYSIGSADMEYLFVRNDGYFLYGSIQGTNLVTMATVRQVTSTMLLVCTDKYPPFYIEPDLSEPSGSFVPLYPVFFGCLLDGFPQGGERFFFFASAVAGTTNDAEILKLSLNPSLMTGKVVDWFIYSITVRLAYYSQSDTSKYAVRLKIRDRGTGTVYSSVNWVRSLPLAYHQLDVTRAVPVTFFFYEKIKLRDDTDPSLGFKFDVILSVENIDTTGQAIVCYEVTSDPYKPENLNPAVVYPGTYSPPIIQINPPPIVGYKEDRSPSPVGGVAGSIIVLPTGRSTVAFGNPITFDFGNEVNVGGEVKQIEGMDNFAVISTSASTLAVSNFQSMSNGLTPTVTPLLPSSADYMKKTSQGIYLLFKGRLFRVHQGGALEIPVVNEVFNAERITYIDDFGIVLLTGQNTELMLAYHELTGSWVYWRLDEVPDKPQIIEYNDGVMLLSDKKVYRFSLEQLQTSYQTAVYIISDYIPNLRRMKVMAAELIGDFFVLNENNARFQITALDQMISAYAVEPLGTPWHNTPPLHAFTAGGTGGLHIGPIPSYSYPFKGQPLIFSETNTQDTNDAVTFQKTLFPEGRRFIIGLFISEDEKKDINNVLLGWRLYGQLTAQNVIGR